MNNQTNQQQRIQELLDRFQKELAEIASNVHTPPVPLYKKGAGTGRIYKLIDGKYTSLRGSVIDTSDLLDVPADQLCLSISKQLEELLCDKGFKVGDTIIINDLPGFVWAGEHSVKCSWERGRFIFTLADRPEVILLDTDNWRLPKVEVVQSWRKCSWEDLEEVSGYYIHQGTAKTASGSTQGPAYKDVWPTKKLAEASLALAQLAQLSVSYNEGTKPENRTIRLLVDRNGTPELCYHSKSFKGRALTFNNKERALAFLEDHEQLIKIATPLL